MNNKVKENLKYLENLNVPFEYIEFNVLNGERRKNIKSEQICKTLVAKGKKTGIIILSIPINKQADWNKVKTFLDDKKVRLVDNVEEITGYPHGANGAITIAKDYPEYTYLIDESLLSFDKLITNAGEYAKTIFIETKDYLNLVPHQSSNFTKGE